MVAAQTENHPEPDGSPQFHGFASSEIAAQSQYVETQAELRRDLAAFDLDIAHGVKSGMAHLEPKCGSDIKAKSVGAAF